MELGFFDDTQDFVFYRQTGRGKTHLAIAIGNACIQNGLEVRFFTFAQLVLRLVKTKHEEKLEALYKDLSRAKLVILDEFGYVPLDIEGARLSFQVITDCYERRSLIITTNIEFGKWGTVFGDDKLAAAVINRWFVMEGSLSPTERAKE